MAFLQALLTILFHQLSRYVNTLFSWATTLLFGKVPHNRQSHLSVIGIGSVLWLILVLGVAFPRLGAFLLAFIPFSETFDRNAVRLVMFGGALILPLGVGVLSLFLVDAEDRPRGLRAVLHAILKGYPYTIGLALTLLFMLILAPLRRLLDMLSGWTTAHVPVMIEPIHYREVVQEVSRVLSQGGLQTRARLASRLLRWPTRVFTFFAGGGIKNLVADELTVLETPNVQLLLHPSDLVIRGEEEYVVRAQAIITEHLTFTRAHLTWSKEAQALEDRLGAIWGRIKNQASTLRQEEALEQLQTIEEELKALKVTFTDWEVLFREVLLVERALLRSVAGLTRTAGESAEAQPEPWSEPPAEVKS